MRALVRRKQKRIQGIYNYKLSLPRAWSLKLPGSEFHIDIPATEKARRPHVL